ncbi:MAG: hypothetical protein R3E82_16440 [Pseudomonadales bacterium]
MSLRGSAVREAGDELAQGFPAVGVGEVALVVEKPHGAGQAQSASGSDPSAHLVDHVIPVVPVRQ